MAFGALKKRYVYIDDAGLKWIIKIAQDRVLNVTPSPALTAYDPANPPSGGTQGVLNPKRCRHVFAQGSVAVGEESARQIKRTFICNPTSTLYESNQAQSVSYTGQDEADAVTLTSTGRRGERFSF